MPITEQIYRVIHQGAPARDAVAALMSRAIRSERG
jgi:glycerol-3-phosphate dehydrogenase